MAAGGAGKALQGVRHGEGEGEGDEGRAARHSQCPGDCPPDNKASARLVISLNCLRLRQLSFTKHDKSE